MLTEEPNSGVHSRKIRQSDNFIGVPIFRSVSGQPLRSAKLGGNIVGLGRVAGFEYNATPYSLRRAYANILYANVSTEDRRFLMGHKTNSDIYSHYHSAVSTVNVQEIFRGIRAGNAAEMHGLSLNRIQQLPQTISIEGWQMVQQDPEIVNESLETSQVRSDLCKLYGSTSAAIRACDSRVESLIVATARLKNRRRVLMAAIYHEEYRIAFGGHHPLQSTIHSPESGCMPAQALLADGTTKILEIAKDKEAIQLPSDFETTGAIDAHGHEGGEDKGASIHHSEFEFVSAETTIADARDWMLEVAQDEEAIQSLADLEIINAVYSHGHEGHDEEVYDQGSFMTDTDFEENGNPSMILPHCLSCGSEAVRHHNINDGLAIPKKMTITRFRDAVSSGVYTDAALSDLMVEVFSAAHKSGKFIPGEEPLPGTYTCRFSGVDLSSNYHAPEAAHSAHSRKVQKAAKEAFEEHFLPLELPCSYYAQGPLKLVNSKVCWFASKTRGDQIKHVFQHTLVLHKKYYAAGNIPHGEWHCYYKGCAIVTTTPTTSDTRDAPKIIMSTSSIFYSEKDYLRHLYYEHRLSPFSVESVSWCGICEHFLEWEQFGTGNDGHFASHWEEVWSLVREHGYTGQFNNGRRTIPSFCPFYLHNENLSPTERISATISQVTRSNNFNHIATHIDAPDFPASYMCPYFPITYIYQHEMPPKNLASHLSNVHGIAMPKTTRTKQRKTQKKGRALGERSVNV
jgi:hypothetical protein